MPVISDGASVTFDVDNVERAREPLPQCKTYQSIAQLINATHVESCSSYSADCVDKVNCQPLLWAVYTAFNQHRPLILTPDALWLTIELGVSHHMAIEGERLRKQFVAHEGRLPLTVEVDIADYHKGSPENNWAAVFEGWADRIRDHVGEATHDLLLCDFSTSGPAERAASRVVMMDIFSRYFEYSMMGICGIPYITLQGSVADWQRLADKAAQLDRFDLGWWLEHLLPICNQFVRAAGGDIDLPHWQNICKLRDDYGGAIINGWVAKLFPYLREDLSQNSPARKRNAIFSTGEGFLSLMAPSGLARVAFVWKQRAKRHYMEALGGLIGVTQDKQTLGLKPQAGWAVREGSKIETLVDQMTKEHLVRPKRLQILRGQAQYAMSRLPDEVRTFYQLTDGGDLFVKDGVPAYRMVPFERARKAVKLPALEWGDWSAPPGLYMFVCDLPDGHYLAMQRPDREESDRPDREFLVVRCTPAAHGTASAEAPPSATAIEPPAPATAPAPPSLELVATGFGDLLDRILHSGGAALEPLGRRNPVAYGRVPY